MGPNDVILDGEVGLYGGINFDDLHDLERKILAFIAEWNEEAAPFNCKADAIVITLKC